MFHIVGAKDRKLLYPKVIWLDFGISKSKGFGIFDECDEFFDEFLMNVKQNYESKRNCTMMCNEWHMTYVKKL